MSLSVKAKPVVLDCLKICLKILLRCELNSAVASLSVMTVESLSSDPDSPRKRVHIVDEEVHV